MEKLYCCRDEVSGRCFGFRLANTDGEYVRMVLPTIQVPLKDVEPVCLGEFNSDKQIEHSVDWACYKFPESKMEAVEPLKLTPDELKQIEK